MGKELVSNGFNKMVMLLRVYELKLAASTKTARGCV